MKLKKGNMTVKQQLRLITNQFLNHCEISAQEAIYLLLQMPLTQCTRGVYFINTCEPDKRIHILKPKNVLLSLPKDSTDIMCEGKIEQYKNLPEELANISLAEFCSCYDIQYRKRLRKEEIDETDNPVENVVNRVCVHISDGKYLVMRQKPKVLRYVRYNIHQDEENYYREQPMLFYPWREECEIQAASETYKQQFILHHEEILHERLKCDKIGNTIEEVMESLDDQALLNAMDAIAPSDRQQREEAEEFSENFQDIQMPADMPPFDLILNVLKKKHVSIKQLFQTDCQIMNTLT